MTDRLQAEEIKEGHAVELEAHSKEIKHTIERIEEEIRHNDTLLTEALKMPYSQTPKELSGARKPFKPVHRRVIICGRMKYKFQWKG